MKVTFIYIRTNEAVEKSSCFSLIYNELKHRICNTSRYKHGVKRSMKLPILLIVRLIKSQCDQEIELVSHDMTVYMVKCHKFRLDALK